MSIIVVVFALCFDCSFAVIVVVDDDVVLVLVVNVVCKQAM